MNVAKNSITNSTRDKENTPAYQVRFQAIQMIPMRNILVWSLSEGISNNISPDCSPQVLAFRPSALKFG
jgi:hypothetical protein